MGNTTRDVDLHYTTKGVAVAEVGLAINRTYKTEDGEKREEATFVDITFWGKSAEIASQYLRKGQPIFVQGRLQLDQWDDKQTGAKRSKLKVVAENLQLLGARPEPPKPVPASTSRPATASASRPAPPPGYDEEPDQIPF